MVGATGFEPATFCSPGAPLFNLEGKVIGMNTAIFTPTLGNVGIAFAAWPLICRMRPWILGTQQSIQTAALNCKTQTKS